MATLLVLNGIDIPDYATRGLSCTIAPIASGELARDINGTLHDLTLPAFQKYGVQISCKDTNVPGFIGVWRGTVIDVTLLPEHGFDETLTDGSTEPITLTMMVDSFQVEQPNELEVLKSWSMSLLEV